MTRGDRRFYAASALVIGVAGAHAFLGAAPQPLPWYFPVERVWRVTTTTDGVAMGWYATTAVSWAGGAALAAIVWLLGGLGREGESPDAFAHHAWGWNAVLFSLGMMALYFVTYRPW